LKRYKLLGHTLGMQFAETENHGVGDEWEGDMDPSVENLLVGAGALSVLSETKASVKKEEPKAPKDEPSAEVKAAAQVTTQSTAQADKPKDKDDDARKPAAKHRS
jgi:hypothetical protein